ncbi:Glycoprotein-N-acetylgalactosamine 3-beta-galactosyltransferase 1 [Chionoecetes opilio]|uniref:Glycoprotein-N-acetylgalactosamine 3-beta-galactosyltransferase 1 n=1 Tax=Chionoecetes opilio TaxID=41210 RepID=A0A8J5D070_CHIOP|nr:Glycoprotein-N-acetylgalactosamine 3-beta-galactosyltransferase 1 [Chionoecetes opilio]
MMAASMMLGGIISFIIFTPPAAKHYRNFREPVRHEDIEEDKEDIPDTPLSSHDPHELHHLGEGVEAARLFEKVRVVCWVMTRPETHEKKAIHVKATWGKRCNKLIFMSSKNDSLLGAIDLGVGDGRDHLWAKTKAAFKYLYDHHFGEYDWFFKADDDTYVVMENMRYMLNSYDPHYPIYFGSRFNKFTKQGYMSGGGGYVLSREALRMFVVESLPNKNKCKQHYSGAEDPERGKCLDNVGVMAGDSRDSLARGRFFPFTPSTHLMGGVPQWYNDYVYYKPDTGLECCSDTAVTFHYVDTSKMYMLEYLLYHLRPYGITHHDPFPAPLPPDTKSIPKQVRERRVLEKMNATKTALKTQKTT